MDRLFILFARMLRRLAFLFERMGQSSSSHRRLVMKESSGYDMVSSPDEPYYAEQYLHWIKQAINQHQKLMALDLGCGQGRLTIPLSKYCEKITGVDFTKQVILKANEYAQEKQIPNIKFICEDIFSFIKSQTQSSYDLVILNEIVFFLPNYNEVIKQIYRVLKPGAVAAISFRPQLFNLLASIKDKQWESAAMVMNKNEGYLWGGGAYFTWQTRQEVEELLKQIGFKEIKIFGIGICSGIEGDPMSAIARPSMLNEEEQRQLQDIELKLAEIYPDQARYMLAVARK